MYHFKGICHSVEFWPTFVHTPLEESEQHFDYVKVFRYKHCIIMQLYNERMQMKRNSEEGVGNGMKAC